MTTPLTADTITTRKYDIDTNQLIALLELRGKITSISLEVEKKHVGDYSYSYRPYVSITTEEKIE